MNDLFFLYSSYALGLIMVIIFAIKEFNAPRYRYESEMDNNGLNKAPYAGMASPTLPKYMADKSRFTIFMIAFVAFACLLYFMLSHMLYVLPIDFLSTTEHKKSMSAILAMLLMIGLVKADEIAVIKSLVLIKWPRTLLFGMIKDWLHGFAYIPSLGCDVFNALCYEQIDRDSDVVKKNINDILQKKYRTDIEVTDYIERNDFVNVLNSESMISRWTRLSYFIHVIDEWSQNQKFKNQVNERSLKWGELKKAYKSVIDMVVRYRNKNEPMSQQEEEDLSYRIDHLLADSYRLISCAVIMTAGANEDPLKYIKDIGLKVNPRARLFAKSGEIFRIIFAMVPTIVCLAFLYTVFDHTDTRTMIQNIIVYVESAFFIMIIPILLVAGLKRQLAMSKTWKVVTEQTQYQSFFEMPLWIYTLVSFLAWATSLVFMMFFMHEKGIAAGTQEWKMMSVYCFISFITSFIACYRIDIPPKVYKSRLSWSLSISRLSGIHGFLTALTVWVGLILSGESGNALWEFPLLGFSVSMALGWTLFYGKHKIEHRAIGGREACNEKVTIIQGQNQFPAIMLNKSSKGVMLILNQARSLIQQNKTIEIKFENGIKKIGSIVRIDLQKLNVAYQ